MPKLFIGKHTTEAIKMRKNHLIADPPDLISKEVLTVEQVDKIPLRIENESTRILKEEMRISENNLQEALNSLSENSIVNDHNGPSADITPDGKNTIWVQFARTLILMNHLSAYSQTFLTPITFL